MRTNRRLTMAALVLSSALAGFVPGFAEPVKLTVVWPGDTVDEGVQQVLRDYEKANNLRIEIVSGGGWEEHYEKLIVMAASGVPFDVAYVDEEHFRATRAGAFADMTPFVERDRVNLSAIHPPALEAFRLRGKQYAMPGLIFSQALAYNRDLFDQYGLVNPASDWGAEGWTWDDFVQAGKKLTRDTDGNGKIDQFGFSGFSYREMPWFWGSDWLSEDLTKLLVTAPKTIEAVQRVAELPLVHRIQPSPAVPYELPSNAFQAGRIGMTPMGTWSIPSWYKGIKFNWDIGAFPKATERHPVIYADGLSIGVTSTHKDEAWDLVRYLTTHSAGALRFSKGRAAIPPLKALGSVWVNDTKPSYPGLNIGVIIHGLPYARRVLHYYNSNFREIENTINAQIESIMRGEKAARQGLEEIAPRIQQLITEGQI